MFTITSFVPNSNQLRQATLAGKATLADAEAHCREVVSEERPGTVVYFFVYDQFGYCVSGLSLTA